MSMVIKNKGGRPRGSVSKKRAMAHEILTQLEKQLGRECNPLEGLLRIGADSTQPVSVRVQCWSEALPYLYPKLQSQAVAISGPDGPIEIADVTGLMENPDLVAMAQELSIAISLSGSPDAARARSIGTSCS
jgi:hypothetical protein